MALPPEEAYTLATRVFSVLIVVCGVAIVIVTVARGGGPISYGIMIGVVFMVLGAARFYLARGGSS